MDYQNLFNTTVLEMRPSGIRKYFDLLDGMEDVITLGVGQPDFPVPEVVRMAQLSAMEDGHVPYTANAGTMELRESISGYLSRRFDLHYAPEHELLVTVGGSEAIDLTLRAVLNPGDEVIVPEPTFVCYGPLARLCGGVVVPLVTTAKEGFKLTPEALRAAITPRTKVLVLPFPTNPTGAIMTRDELSAIAEVLEDTDILVLSDEVYAELTYTGHHVSPASLPAMRDRTVVIGSASKNLAMTGARLGYAAAPAPIIAAMTRIHQYGIMSAPTVAQIAAAKAFASCDADIERMRLSYDRRRCLMLGGFASMELPCREPQGAFYLFPDISASGLTSEEFCDRLLTEGRVAVIPGTAFGDSGEGYIRICYAYAEEKLYEALRRIAIFWRKVTGLAA
ncbi:MAG: aminotransferase class I/II-fold pyridoxal phosphate-dependent enzyme [Clostridiaceae bacterium]|nr:aminotransferase class I/II-fold pyridoxal phosphate-dependent enzyme [Clostridiaceae bacterium]